MEVDWDGMGMDGDGDGRVNHPAHRPGSMGTTETAVQPHKTNSKLVVRLARPLTLRERQYHFEKERIVSQASEAVRTNIGKFGDVFDQHLDSRLLKLVL